MIGLRWARLEEPPDRRFIYVVDGLNRPGGVRQADHIVAASWEKRSYFSIHNRPALLKVGHVTVSDTGTYVCTVSFEDGLHVNTSRLRLVVIGKW